MIKEKEIKFSMPNPITLEERETVITFDETQAPAEIYTHNPAMIRKLDALCEERPKDIQCIRAERMNENIHVREYRCPKKWVRVQAPRIMSDEERAAMSERGRVAMARLHSASQ